MFETVVERCLAQGLIGAEGFAVDASLIAADANKQRSVREPIGKPKKTLGAPCRNIWLFSMMRLSGLPRR